MQNNLEDVMKIEIERPQSPENMKTDIVAESSSTSIHNANSGTVNRQDDTEDKGEYMLRN